MIITRVADEQCDACFKAEVKVFSFQIEGLECSYLYLCKECVDELMEGVKICQS